MTDTEDNNELERCVYCGRYIDDPKHDSAMCVVNNIDWQRAYKSRKILPAKED